MTTIAAKDVMNLRQRTGLGMMECKQALQDADGDTDKAVDLLRSKGLAKMDGRADRSSTEGRIAVQISDDKTKVVMVEMNCETDFTANNDSFREMTDQIVTLAFEQPAGDVAKTDAMQALIDEVRLTTKENAQFGRGQVLGGTPNSRVGSYLHFTGKVGVIVELQTPAGGDPATLDALLADLCMHIAAATPTPAAVTEEGVPAETVDKEREIAKAQAIEQGKPEQIAEKMVEGKIRKFYDEHVLLRQAFIKDDKKKIKDLLPDGVTIQAFARFKIGS